MQSDERILVGKIVAPQGIKGEVRVQTFTERPSDFQNLSVFGDNFSADSLHFVRVVPNSNVVIMKIDGVTDRNVAEKIRGTDLYVYRSELPPTKSGEYYQADLIGMTVIRQGVELGHIVCFQNFGAGDIMELDNGDMVSFKGADVDFENKNIKVK